ncbi:MAG TPA: hypothetical protein VF159_03385 [Gemmatimonadaceae bacterium]
MTRPILRAAVVLCAATSALLTLVSVASAQNPWRRTVTRADIESLGWVRISDILQAAEGWRLASTDAMTYTPTASGLPPAGESSTTMPLPAVYIDGAPIPAAILGNEPLELVPITVAQIDSVVFESQPVFLAGRVETQGVMRIYSHRPNPGFWGRGSVEVGDIANKFGLFRFTPMQTPNKEHLGPWWNGLFGVAGSRAGVDVGMRYLSINTTDTLITQRQHAFPYAGGEGQINVAVPTLHAFANAFGGRHDLQLGHEHYSGLYFVPALGHEQTLRMDGFTGALSGDATLPARTTFSYRATYAGHDVHQLPSPWPFTVGHQRKNFAGGGELSHAFDSVRVAFGADVDVWQMQRESMSLRRTDARISTSLSSPLGAGSGYTANLAATYTPRAGGSDASALASFVGRPTEADDIALTATVSTEWAEAHGRWIDALAAGASLDTQRIDDGRLDAAWTHTLPAAWHLMLGASAQRVTGWAAAPVTDTGLVELQLSVRAPAVQGNATLAAARLGIESPASDTTWHARLMYSYTAPLSADSAIDAAERAVARHQLTGTAWWVPGHDWRLGALAAYTSATTWSAFPPLATGWPSNVAAIRRVDLSAEKWMWRRTIRAQLLYRNLFDSAERYHPRSVESDLRWFVLLAYELPRHP